MAILMMGLALPALAQTRIEVCCDEAEAVLGLLARQGQGQVPAEADWSRLFESEGYRRLVQREASMGHRVEAGAFRAFVQGPELSERREDLVRTLEVWRRVDVNACARRSLAYLPQGARIQAKVCILIKPWKNSFVFEGHSLFLYLDPSRSAPRFENTLVHELHHIGLDSLEPEPALKAELARLPEGARQACEWTGAFGEGWAMLAAAGGPEIHPHALGSAEERQRWDRDMARFDEDLRRVEAFLMDVAQGRLKGEAIPQAGSAFYGFQGPWYTVGWRMAATVEKVFGRARLLDCMKDPRRLLSAFNQAVAEAKLPHATWSPRLLEALGHPRP